MGDATTLSRFRVEGMDCASCAAKITTAVRRVPGVEDVTVSVSAGTMTVDYVGDAHDGAVVRQVNGLGGYRASPLRGKATSPDRPAGDGGNHDHDLDGHDSYASHEAQGHDDGPSDLPWWRSRKASLTLASGIALFVAFVVAKVVPTIAPYTFPIALLVGLLPVARRAILAARFGTPFSIEMLMTIAAIGAVAIGAGEEGAVVIVLFLVGEMLEGVAAGRARASIRGLTSLVPKTARVQSGSEVREVSADSLRVGDTLLVRPGDRIAADGEIIDGESAVDEAPVTGESVPKRKGKGSPVFAGTINADGVLRVRVTAVAEDNTIARVVRLVEEAQESKAPTERFIDRFSRHYTPAVVAVAALVAVLPPLLSTQDWGTWIYRGLAILLIGCPCALVISTPAAIAAGLSAGARRGLLLKGGAVLEALGSVQVMALDKTGTLTSGKPVVTDVIPQGRNERDLLSLAAALETGSSHPLALAILARAKADCVPMPPAADAASVAGEGVTGRVGGLKVFLGSSTAAAKRASFGEKEKDLIQHLNEAGKSVAVLVANGEIGGFIAMRDEPRADAKAGLEAIRAAGIETVMLTGDNRRTAEAIGASLGVTVHADLLPEDKQRIVREMQARGRKVAKVGDGINDAPALAAADVGIAMGGGTDVALETADAAVLHGRVTDLARMVELSRATMGNIRQNVTVALGLKAVFLVTTVIGVTGLWPAILADTGATVLVTANAMRLLRSKDA